MRLGYAAVGREVQLRPDRSGGGHGSVHQVGELQKHERGTQEKGSRKVSQRHTRRGEKASTFKSEQTVIDDLMA